jgi:serine kinase of HPr protein (carbohydrate metabolism regulator)
VVGDRGILFVGASGIGKSMMAFQCLTIARRRGSPSALIADDQVLMSREGAQIIGTCPAPIAGMMELRGSGIVHLEHVERAAIDLVVEVVSPGATERLPPQRERWNLDAIGELPLVRVANAAPDPLAVIGALLPEWRGDPLFW